MSEVTSVNGKTGAVVLTAADVEAVPGSAEGQPNGVATLNASGVLPEAQLPDSVTDASLTVVVVGAASGTDDTSALQSALDSMKNGSTLVLRSGQVYKVSNLVIPNLSSITIDLNGSTIQSTGTGDGSYLIASYNWVNNVTTPGNQLVAIKNGSIVAAATMLPSHLLRTSSTDRQPRTITRPLSSQVPKRAILCGFT